MYDMLLEKKQNSHTRSQKNKAVHKYLPAALVIIAVVCVVYKYEYNNKKINTQNTDNISQSYIHKNNDNIHTKLHTNKKTYNKNIRTQNTNTQITTKKQLQSNLKQKNLVSILKTQKSHNHTKKKVRIIVPDSIGVT